MADTIETIANALAENERGLAALYESFAAAFPIDRDLWAGLAREEEEHASWIRRAVDGLPPEARRRPMLTVRLPAVTTMIRYVSSLVGRCRRGELTRRTAIALGRDLENSLLEGKLLTVLDTPPLTTGGVGKALAESTAQHRSRLIDALQRVPD
jgi:hypothetical protein